LVGRGQKLNRKSRKRGKEPTGEVGGPVFFITRTTAAETKPKIRTKVKPFWGHTLPNKFLGQANQGSNSNGEAGCSSIFGAKNTQQICRSLWRRPAAGHVTKNNIPEEELGSLLNNASPNALPGCWGPEQPKM